MPGSRRSDARSSARPSSPVRPVVHRDAEGNARVAPAWEPLVERLIREAQEAGRFDDLPDRGRPLRLIDDLAAGEMATAYQVLRNAHVAPPWIEADKEVRAHRHAIEALLEAAPRTRPVERARLVRRLFELADEHDRAVARLDILAPSPRRQRRPLDRAKLKERLDAALHTT
jgi:hypothetical protein